MFATKKVLGRSSAPYFPFFLPHRAAAPRFAIALRFAGVKLSARAFPLSTAFGSATFDFTFGFSPVATSTMYFASWAVSLGRLGVMSVI